MMNEYYGFSAKPFQLTPDPEFYFRSATHRKALSYLGYGLAQGEGFIVITGEIGSGKSTLVAHMMQNLDPQQVSVAQVVTSKLNEDELIHVVARSFGLDIEGHDKATALGEIEGFLHEEAREGRRCLLVVDETQNLSIPALEELRMLSNFQLGNHPLLQVLLLGQPEFRETLQTSSRLEQLRQRVIAAHHLEGMQKNEIEAYITHRLQKVGWNGNPSFDQDVYAGLFEATGGIPRKVNQVVNRLLLLGAVEQRNRIDSAMLDHVLGEMDSERSLHAAPAVPAREQEREEAVETGPETPDTGQPAAPVFDPQLVDDLLAERDVQIAELQQAVVELSQSHEALERQLEAEKEPDPEVAELREQVARLEARTEEQERAIHKTLSMLIEWIEEETATSKAA